MDEWTDIFKNEVYNFKGQLNFITHSLGSLVALKLIEKHDIKVNKAIFVALPKNKVEGDNPGRLWKKLEGIERETLKNFVEQQFKWDTIKTKIDSLHLFFSEDDYAIPYDQTVPYYQDIFPNANFKLFKDYGHFNRRNNIDTLPEVLQIIKDKQG